MPSDPVMAMGAAPPLKISADVAMNGRARPARPLAFVIGLCAIPLLVVALCLLVPAGAIPPEVGFAASCVVMLGGFAAAHLVGRRCRIALPVPMRVVVVIAAVKLAIGVWSWGTYKYELATQMPRTVFLESAWYWERSSDVGCLVAINDIWNATGIHYISEDEAFIPINNRPPAHLAALVVRAFGMQFHAYFPFVALLAGLGSMAVMATLAAVSTESQSTRALGWLAVLWPFGWGVGDVMKDVTLWAFVALCCSLLTLAHKVRRGTPAAIVASMGVLPMFRPAYAFACLLPGLLAFLRGRVGVLTKTVVVVAMLLGGVVLERMLGVTDKLASYAAIGANTSEILDIPILGRIVFGFGTPFPWTNALDSYDWVWIVFIHAQQVVTGALLLGIIHSLVRGRWVWPDEGAVLGIGLIGTGLLAPYINAAYVHVGSIGLLPYAARVAPQRLRWYLALSLGAYLMGNVIWLWLRPQ